jgi:hypothetical protein
MPTTHTLIGLIAFATLSFTHKTCLDIWEQKVLLHNYRKEVQDMKLAITENAEALSRKLFELERKQLENISEFSRSMKDHNF